MRFPTRKKETFEREKKKKKRCKSQWITKVALHPINVINADPKCLGKLSSTSEIFQCGLKRWSEEPGRMTYHFQKYF